MTNLAAIAAEGSRLSTLRALRDRLAADIDECESKRDVATLSQRLVDVLEQIADIEAKLPQPKGTPLDEFTQRRSAKTQAKGSARTASK